MQFLKLVLMVMPTLLAAKSTASCVATRNAKICSISYKTWGQGNANIVSIYDWQCNNLGSAWAMLPYSKVPTVIGTNGKLPCYIVVDRWGQDLLFWYAGHPYHALGDCVFHAGGTVPADNTDLVANCYFDCSKTC